MISAIGSDVATWHPPPQSYEMHGHGSGAASSSPTSDTIRPYPSSAHRVRCRSFVELHSGTLGHAGASSRVQGCEGPSSLPPEAVKPRARVFRAEASDPQHLVRAPRAAWVTRFDADAEPVLQCVWRFGDARGGAFGRKRSSLLRPLAVEGRARRARERLRVPAHASSPTSPARRRASSFAPRSVVRLLTRIIDPQPTETIYDPACGSGGMLVVAFVTSPRRVPR